MYKSRTGNYANSGTPPMVDLSTSGTAAANNSKQNPQQEQSGDELLRSVLKRVQRDIVAGEALRPSIQAQATTDNGLMEVVPDVGATMMGVVGTTSGRTASNNNARSTKDISSAASAANAMNTMTDERAFGKQACPATLRFAIDYCRTNIEEKLSFASIGNMKESMRAVFHCRAILDKLLKEVPHFAEFQEGGAAPTRPIGQIKQGDTSFAIRQQQQQHPKAPQPPPTQGTSSSTGNTQQVPPSSSIHIAQEAQSYLNEFRREPIGFVQTGFMENITTGRVEAVVDTRDLTYSTLLNVGVQPPPQQQQQQEVPSHQQEDNTFGNESTSFRSTGGGGGQPQNNNGAASYNKAAPTTPTSPTASRGGGRLKLNPSTSGSSAAILVPAPPPPSSTTQEGSLAWRLKTAGNFIGLPTTTPRQEQKVMAFITKQTERTSQTTQTDNSLCDMVGIELYKEAKDTILQLEGTIHEQTRLMESLEDQLHLSMAALTSRSSAITHLRGTLLKECTQLRKQLLFLGGGGSGGVGGGLPSSQVQYNHHPIQSSASSVSSPLRGGGAAMTFGHVITQSSGMLSATPSMNFNTTSPAGFHPERTSTGYESGGVGGSAGELSSSNNGGPPEADQTLQHRRAISLSLSNYGRSSSLHGGTTTTTHHQQQQQLLSVPQHLSEGAANVSNTTTTNSASGAFHRSGSGGVLIPGVTPKGSVVMISSPDVNNNSSHSNNIGVNVSLSGEGSGGAGGSLMAGGGFNLASTFSLLDTVLLAVETGKVLNWSPPTSSSDPTTTTKLLPPPPTSSSTLPTVYDSRPCNSLTGERVHPPLHIDRPSTTSFSAGSADLTGENMKNMVSQENAHNQAVHLYEHLQHRNREWKASFLRMQAGFNLALRRKDREIAHIKARTDLDRLRSDVFAEITLAKEDMLNIKAGISDALEILNGEFGRFMSQTEVLLSTLGKEVRESRAAVTYHKAAVDLPRAMCEIIQPMVFQEFAVGVHPSWNCTDQQNSDPLWTHMLHTHGADAAHDLRTDIQRAQQLLLFLQRYFSQSYAMPHINRPATGSTLHKLASLLILSQSCTNDLAVKIREVDEMDHYHSQQMARFSFRLKAVTFYQQVLTLRARNALLKGGINPDATPLPVRHRITRIMAKATSLRSLRQAVTKARLDNAKRLWRLWHESGIDVWHGAAVRPLRDPMLAHQNLHRHIAQNGPLILGLLAPNLVFSVANLKGK